MPPKTVPKIPEGFISSTAGNDMVICVVCAAVAPPGQPIQRTSATNHVLRSKDHARALQQQQQQQILHQQRADSARAARAAQQEREQLAHLPKTELHLPEKSPAVDDTTQQFWAEFDADSSDFRIDLETSAAEIVADNAECIRKELDTFGDFDDIERGYELGADQDIDLLAQNRARNDEQQMEDALAALLSSEGYTEDAWSEKDTGWYPYPSKLLFLLDVADNLGRLRISESLMKLFLYILKEAGVKNVPSIGAFRKFQTSLRENGSGVPTIHCKSVQDKIFYINDVRKMVANLKSGRFVIPLRWITRHRKICADAYEVLVDDDGIATVVDSSVVEISASDLVQNFHDLEHGGKLPVWSMKAVDAGHPDRMPNPDRKIAQGRPMYTSLINFFSDDVSGNWSKSWNKHFNCYFTHANLPREFHQQEAHVHFVSTSQHATVPEQFCEVRKIVVGTHTDPILIKDPLTNEEALVRLGINVDSSDNPMQSEICSHIGNKGNFPCRKCEVGGTQLEKQSNLGYHAFFFPGVQRNKNDVVSIVRQQLDLACLGVSTHVETLQTDTGIKDSYAQYWITKILNDCEDWVKSERANRERPTRIRDLREEFAAKQRIWIDENFEDIINPFFLVPGHDPTQDTPLEILHVILLGIVKYIWFYSHSTWKDPVETLYAQRLQATDIDGLSIPPVRANYIMQYANSLIGRQLKAVVQTGVFHTHDLVDNAHYATWKAVGDLAALLWVPEIDDMDQYCDDLKIAVANVLDAFADIDPSKMILKIKLHLLTHLPDDVRRFGPLIGVATEIFEAFNAVFRAASVLSNHRALSRDIARQLASQEGARSLALGTLWFDTQSEEWQSAGPSVKRFMDSQPNLKKMMGLNVRDDPRPGTTKLAPLPAREAGKPRPKRQTVALRATQAQKALNFLDHSRTDGEWYQAKTLIARSGDSCSVNSWVFFNVSTTETAAGRILELLVSLADTNSDILFVFNAQHDCIGGKCAATGVRRLEQEREETNITEAIIEHTEHSRYIINTSAFHNAHLLRRELPRNLARPIPTSNEDERRTIHEKRASDLRAATSRKRKDRRDDAERKAKEAAAARQKAEELEKAAAEAAAQADEEDMDMAPPPRQPPQPWLE
ncbi:hypothetical protein MSAN_00284300 [Mycena sanguinolenta]|uniref:Uncharacterized protein n=1 Tax=Mycena sanguinolenta TaxID=230812 RepID=A0A8H7DJZ0_9AGAR|nr:hypothetical protein MSAN_00284300 [Mycena sanguinolenta]